MSNRLAHETSPYLLQHQDNPVDWYPWGAEAFEAARAADKPILLSVGYSSCHWCHVMAHESFEDPETAALMNELFVNVKVDREERPDVDGIYMNAVQAMTGRGGWPMTVWLNHDRAPFYAGTYFPPDDRHGMPSFRRVMEAVNDAWVHRRDGVTEQAEKMAAAIDRQIPPGEKLPSQTDLEQAYLQLAASFDERHGGLGGAPKFPQEPVLEFLLRIADEPWAPQAAADGRRHPDSHVGRRDLRPSRRRFLPLFGGCPLGDPPLREDAVQQRPTGPPIPAGLAGVRVRAPHGPWDRRPLRAPPRRGSRNPRVPAPRHDPSRWGLVFG